MSNAKRKGVEFTGNQFGKATFVFDKLIGDISTPDSIRLDFENNYTRIKGSSIYSDYDLNSKDPMGENPTNLTTFDSNDIPNYVIQGGNITVSKNVYLFSNTGSWHPNRYSPPSPEGWQVYDYNAFSNYVPAYNSSGQANSNYIIYNPLYEPSTGIARTQFNYPVRWNGDDYERVPLFNFASWVSVANIGSTDISNLRLVVPKFKFDGALDINPKTNAPKDILIYSHSNLVSNSISYPLTLSGTMGVEGSSDELEPLAFEVYESDIYSDFTTRNRDYYTFNIDIPNTYEVNPNDWLHLLFYWGSHDSHITDIKPTYSAIDFTPYELPGDQENLNYYIWPKNSFFNKKTSAGIGFSKTGVNDTNIYLYNQNNSKTIYEESKYTERLEPFRYKLNEEISGSSTGISNSTLGLKELNFNQFLPIILASKNSGSFYDEPKLNLEIFYGDTIESYEIPNSWDEFNYYPEIPEDYNIISKIIVGYNFEKFNTPIFKTSSSYINVDNSIVYIEMVAENVFKEPIGDTEITKYFLDSFNSKSSNFRDKSYLDYYKNSAKSLLTRFVRMNLNKFINLNILSNSNIFDFLTFHSLAKLPSSELLKVPDNIEPKAIQFNEDTLNIINDFATISTSKNFAGFNSTSLYLNKIELDHNVDFEVYLERSYDEFYNHLYDDSHGLSRDYSFKIKFKNTNNDYVIKNLYLNASKYVLDQSDYNKRLDQNLSTAGYFIKGQYNSIEDYKIHSDAALIPDLKRESYRQILNKQNSPFNTSRLTEEEYESLLVESNPSITKDQIIENKSGFGLTDSFYVIDSSKPSEQYSSITELGMTVSNYSLKENFHWLNNIEFLYGQNSIDNISNAKHLKDLRCDGFIIAGSGYTITDDSIIDLENISDQQIFASTASTVNQTIQLGIQRINNKKIAIKITCDITQEIKGFKVKLKNTSNYLNQNSIIQSELYSNKNNLPDQLLALGSKINLKDLNYILDDNYFYLDYKLFENKIYWLVLSTTQLPPLYEPNVSGLINLNGTGVSGIYNPNNNTFTDFEQYNTGIEIGIGTNVGSNVTTWYSISSIASSNFMTIANTGTTVDSQNYSLRYFYGLGIKESTTSGATKNLATYSSVGWTSYEGTAFIELYKPDVEIYGSFNKDYSNSNLIIPSPNKYRETSDYKMDEFWSLNCKKFDDPQQLYIYPRSVKLKKIEVIGSGSNGTNVVSIASSNYNEKILSGLAISQSSYFSAGTSITNIYYNSSDDSYKLILNQNISSTFSNQTVGIGTSGNQYCKRANDVYIYLNYVVNSGIYTTTITLEKSPTWKTYWYSKAKNKYNHLQKELKSDVIAATHDLYFQNQSVIGATSYINGYSIGIFSPKSSIGYTIEFKFVSSGGLKLFINDSNTPSIDKWTTSASLGFTHTHYLTTLSEETKLEVQFNHNKTSSGTGQTIIGYWKIPSDVNWSLINDSFYVDNSINPVLISTENIDSLSLLNVVKTEQELTKPNYGSPLNDLIVLRSA